MKVLFAGMAAHPFTSPCVLIMTSTATDRGHAKDSPFAVSAAHNTRGDRKTKHTVKAMNMRLMVIPPFDLSVTALYHGRHIFEKNVR